MSEPVEFDYKDERGNLLFQIRRMPGDKQFRARQPMPSGGWEDNINGVRLVLYGLDQIQGLRRVFIVEGEKDADRLRALGLPAVTNPFGAGKWKSEFTLQLVEAGVLHVVLLPDQDEPGQKHMSTVLRDCLAANMLVTRVQLPGVPGKGDVSDYLDANSLDDLLRLISEPNDARQMTLPTGLIEVVSRVLEALENPATPELQNLNPALYMPYSTEMMQAILQGGDNVRETPYLDAMPGVTDDERIEIMLLKDRYLDKKRMWGVLRDTNNPPDVFLYGNQMFQIWRGELVPFGPTELHNRLIEKVKWKTTKKGVVERANLDDTVLRLMMVDREGLAQMPVLKRVVKSPVFTKSGKLIVKPGYDAESGIYLAIDPDLNIPEVSSNPTLEEIARARSLLLDDVYVDFPFKDRDSGDLATIVALTLLPFVRDMIDGQTPLHILEAAKHGTGKSLLLKVASVIATGKEAGAMSQPTKEEDFRKEITAQLVDHPTYVVIENINATLQGASLAQAITGKVWEGRVLGLTKMWRGEPACCWVAVGNQPTLSDEIADRAISCRIVATVVDPRARKPETFKHAEKLLPDGTYDLSLRKWVEVNRADLLWACLTLIQAWIAADKPVGGAVMGTFQEWADVMSGILKIAGIPGLTKNRAAMKERVDAGGMANALFVQMWREAKGFEVVRPSEMVEMGEAAGVAVDSKKRNLDGSVARSEATKMGDAMALMTEQTFDTDKGQVVVEKLKRDALGSKYRLVVSTGEPKSEPESSVPVDSEPPTDADEYLGGAA